MLSRLCVRARCSLAAFSIASYVLGIGDRHLDNFLLDTSDGMVVGIDFGMAFGNGTSMLPVPELLPFRLTQQFTSLLQPLDTEVRCAARAHVPLRTTHAVAAARQGLLKQHMVHAMQALHDGRQILLNVLDVFVKEPLLDWVKEARSEGGKRARMGAGAGGGSSGETTTVGSDGASAGSEWGQAAWYPLEKIATARRKLELGNPASIMERELETNRFLALPAHRKVLAKAKVRSALRVAARRTTQHAGRAGCRMCCGARATRSAARRARA